MAQNKKIVIEYDINGKPIDVAIDKTLNLKRQVVELTKALRSVREGGDEFKLLSSKLGDVQDQLAKSNAKSKDLFTSLSLLPGSLGSFFSELQQGIELLKVFSSYSLKDLQFQFKETANDIGDIGKNLTGVEEPTKNATKANNDLAESAERSAQSLNTAAGSNIKVARTFQELTKEQQKAMVAGQMFDRTTGQVVSQTQNMTDATRVNTQTVNQNTVATEGAAASNGLLATAFRAVGASALAASSAVAILDAALAAVGIGLLIAGIVALGTALFNVTKSLLGFKEETKENIAMTDAFTAALKREEEALGLDLEAIDLSTKALETRAKIAGKSEKEILEITKQGGRDRLQALRDYDEVLYKEQRELAKNKKLTAEQSEKLNTEINNKLIANGRAINKQIMMNEQALLDGRLSLSTKYKDKWKEIQGNRLKELEALIKLEIDKENTGKEELEKLLKEKLQIRIKLEKLSLAERKVIIAENAKIVNDALIDDAQRVIQAEIDKYTRLGIKSGILTKEFFDNRKKQIKEEYLKELQEAEKDEKTKATKQQNAITNYGKKLLDLYKEYLDGRVNIAEISASNEYEGTVAFFEKQRNLEDEKYAVQQAAARGNYEKLEELRRDHNRKLEAIDIAEIRYKAGLEEKKAQTEQENYTDVEDRFFQSYKIIRDLNTRKYEDLRKAAKLNYDADIKAAGDNAKLREQIELDFAAKIHDLQQQEFEAKQQVYLMTEQAAQTMGQNLSTIGDAIMQESKGRNEAMFKAGKAVAIAGVAVEKAAAIASIWTNNAIANAKAVAAFPLTAGQPWVTINTVSAAVSTAATIAAAALAISQINGTSFNSTDNAGGEYNGLGRNYGDGGMIEGPRHANGGVPITAEGGEAIMTRGAVTMFGPLLSMLNQAGGGTSFSQGAVGAARFDNPKISNPAESAKPMVLKTYVVSNELTSEAQKQSRLKDLSTL